MNTKLIALGLIFLFNPVIQVFDIMPDFFGAALILYGIYKLGRLEENGLEARKAFSWLLYFSIARTVTAALILSTSSLSGAWPILLAATFSYFEAHFTIVGFRKLLRSVELLGLSSNNAEIYDNPKTKPFFRLTVIFLVFRTIFAIIPEFTALVPPEVQGLGPQRNMVFITAALSVINGLVVLGLGIAWLIRGRRFFRDLGAKTEFQTYLKNRYDSEITNVPGAPQFYTFKNILLLICAALVFSIPLLMDGIDVLPTFVSGVFFVWAGFLLRYHYKKPANILIASGSVYFVLSLFEWVRRLNFVTSNFNLFTPETVAFREIVWAAVERHPEVAAEYNFLLVLSIVRMGLYAVTMGAAVWGMMAIIRNHTGLDAEIDLEFNRKRGQKVRGILYTLLMMITAAFIGSVVMSVITALLYFDAQGLWMIDVIIAVAVVVLLRAFTEKTIWRIKGRYHLE